MRPAYYIRASRGETLGEVAQATGLNPDTISLFERGDTVRPSPGTLAKLAEHYGVTVRELLVEEAAA